jgi:hypothetical protein
MISKSLRITKTWAFDDDGYWAIYLQRGKYRYYHLPTVGRPDLKALVGRLNAKGVEANLSDDSIWKREDTTCPCCAGHGQWFTEVLNDKPQFKGECARCAGKGYMTVSDERRYASYLNHRWAA